MKKIAVIMAGGYGLRMWPRSTEKNPKQFNHFIGDGTMITNTVARLLPLFKPEEIFIVAEKDYRKHIYDQIPMIPEDNVILEPIGRRTAPCLALTATALKDRCTDDTVMYAFPSDHVIHNVREFHQSLETAGKFALEREKIVTIGITPTRPETGYGYIQVKNDKKGLNEYYNQGVRYSNTFAEKPDIETARRFINSGDFLWNSGIFIWRIDTFWKNFRNFLPEHYQLFEFLSKHVGKDTFRETREQIYRQMEAESVDYAILEKSEDVYVVEASFSWSDLGNWDEFYRLSLKDGRNNFIEGDVIAVNTRNCLVSAHERFIGIIGVENLIVVDSDDALLICRRKHSEDVGEIVDTLKRKNINHYL